MIAALKHDSLSGVAATDCDRPFMVTLSFFNGKVLPGLFSKENY